MKLMMDIGLANNGDLKAVNGDWVVVESTGEHQKSLILDNKGDYKYAPTSCVGAINYIDSENANNLTTAISVEFAKDGMNIKKIEQLPTGNIEVDALYR